MMFIRNCKLNCLLLHLILLAVKDSIPVVSYEECRSNELSNCMIIESNFESVDHGTESVDDALNSACQIASSAQDDDGVMAVCDQNDLDYDFERDLDQHGISASESDVSHISASDISHEGGVRGVICDITADEKCQSLKSVMIYVPEVVKSGDTVTLSCDYDLEQAALYTIKWYLDDVEFYRFVPKESPPSKAFSVPFINVDISRSGPKEVTLRGVRRELTGDYKCEVSADAPLFHTEIKSAHMAIAELPSENPSIIIDHPKVEIGKQIRADCTASGSDPAANLTWFINDEEVTDDTEHVKLFPLSVQSDSALGLHSSRSRIEIVANRSHFNGGYMILRCEANIYSLWHGVVDRFLRDETPQLAPVLGSTSSQSHSEDNLSFFGSSADCSLFSSGLASLLLILLLAR